MPLKLRRPRQGKTPNFEIRGTYLGIRVEKSSGTARRSIALSQLKRLEEQIERGEYPPKQATPGGEQLTFLKVANDYLAAGKRRKYVGALIRQLGETPLDDIDQGAIDAAGEALYPRATNGTRNACVHTPAIAILHHHYGEKLPFQVRRPKGARGRRCKDWVPPPDMAMIIDAAEEIDQEFALFLLCLLYTGLRPHEPLAWQREHFHEAEQLVWTRRGKGGSTSDVKLRPDLCARMAAHLASHDRRRIFRFHQGGHLTYLLVRAKLKSLGINCPTRRPTGWRQPPNRFRYVNFKVFRHTFATWMRRYGGASTDDLLDSRNWLDPKSVRRYVHAAPVDGIWDKVRDLPGKIRGMK